MAKRYFTPEEANEALSAVRPLAELMVEHRRELASAQARQAELAAAIAGNGGGIQPSELAGVQTRIVEKAAEVTRCIEGIHALGAVVKDLDQGLIDFPALRGGGVEVLLCWRVGEDAIRYWHGVEEGFAGRKELPLEP